MRSGRGSRCTVQRPSQGFGSGQGRAPRQAMGAPVPIPDRAACRSAWLDVSRGWRRARTTRHARPDPGPHRPCQRGWCRLRPNQPARTVSLVELHSGCKASEPSSTCKARRMTMHATMQRLMQTLCIYAKCVLIARVVVTTSIYYMWQRGGGGIPPVASTGRPRTASPYYVRTEGMQTPCDALEDATPRTMIQTVSCITMHTQEATW
jgi:hypothetical protein